MVNIAICDDDQAIITLLKGYIAEIYDEWNIDGIDEYMDGTDLLAAYASGMRYDIVFLDMEMPHISGVKVGQEIRNMDIEAIIFFVTAHRKYVRDAFHIDAFQFLEKPVNRNIFEEEYLRAINALKYRKTQYAVEFNGSKHLIEIGKIIYVETLKRKMNCVTTAGEVPFVGAMNAEAEKLRPYDFVRVHKSYIVNMNYIAAFFGDKVKLKSAEEIPIGRRYKAEFLRCYNMFLSRCTI